MKPKLFIDGEHGTTGLQIRERLASRDDLEIISLAQEDRRDNNKRLALLGECDYAILCLPDDAARAVAQDNKLVLFGRPMGISFQAPDGKDCWPPPSSAV